MQYKQLLQNALNRHKRQNPSFRNFQLALRLKIEPSYLSRFLSNSETHFSDDLLFLFMKELALKTEEIERVFLLRDLERCTHPERRKQIEEKLCALKTRRLTHEVQKLKQELECIVKILGQTN